MNKKQLYTALSRTTKFKYIHAENLKSKYTYNVNNIQEVKSIGHTECQKGKIYKIEFEGESIHIESTIKTLEMRLKEHLSDIKSIVYKNKDKNPKISLIVHCPCENKHKLEKVEKKYMNQYAKKYGDKILNKRGNDENKEKLEFKYSFKIEKEDELMKRIDKIVAIKNDKKNKKLEIQFRDGNKKVKVSKRYSQIPLTEVMDFMKKQQQLLKQQLSS